MVFWFLVIRGSQKPAWLRRARGLTPPQVPPRRTFFSSFFRCVFNRFLFALGSFFHPNLPPKIHQNPPKIDSKINQFLNAFWDRIFAEFSSILGPKMEPSWYQNRTKNRSQLRKADFAKNLIKPMVFLWFFGFRALKLGPKIDQKSIKKESLRWTASWHRFLVDFGANLAPFWLPKSTKIHQKSNLKKLKKIDWFLNQFLAILAPFWEPSWAHLGL